jgi:virginiamycin B lyase
MTPFKKIFLLFTFLLLYLLVNISIGDEQGQHAMHGDTTSVAPTKAGEGPVINEYVLPTPYSHPFGIAVDSKDNIWFTAQVTNKIVKFDPSNQTFKEYQIPSTASLTKSEWKYSPTERTTPKDVRDVTVGSPGAIIIDKNDRLWFVEQIGNKIGSFDPATEKFVEYDIPTPQSNPNDLAIDSEGNVWFVEWNSGKIGKLDFKLKKILEYDLESNGRLAGITVDAEDNIWITDTAMNEVGRFTPKTKSYRAFPIVTPISRPGKILVDSSNNIWFTQLHSHKVAMLIPSTGMMSEAIIPGYNSVPQSIIFDKKGRLWYIDDMMNKIGYFEHQSASFNEFDIPTINSQPMNMAIDSKGDIWFTEHERGANKIAQLVISTVPDAPVASTHVHSEENKGQVEGVQESAVVGKVPLWVYPSGILLIVVIISALIFVKKKRA